jgi:hypothetical protein
VLILAGGGAAAGQAPDRFGALLLSVSDPGHPQAPDRFSILLLGSSSLAAQPLPTALTAGRQVATIEPMEPPPPALRMAPRYDLLALLIDSPGPRGGGAAVPQPAIHAQEPDPTSLLLLSAQLDDLMLSDGLAAYGSPDDPLIPVGELSRLLELDVDVSPSEGRIVGRLGQAQRSLVVDLATGSARVGAVRIDLEPADVAITQTEIYLRASALQKLLPIKLTVDPAALSMRITALELLPLQSRLLRQQRAGLTGAAPGAKALRVESPYKLFTPPSFDVALGVGAAASDPKFPLRYDLRLGGDLLYSGLQAYLGSDETGRPTSARVLLSRRSLKGDLLGPLHAHDVSVGDVFTPGLAIGPRSINGRGISVSTVPLDQAYVFNRIDLRGELRLGDDVEIYVNDVLHGEQNTPVQGRYEFLNVPLTQGVNIVRIVTYGPRGQRTEETRVINVSGGLLRRGQATLEFGAVQQSQDLFEFRDQTIGIDRSIGKPRAVVSLNYGLTQSLTLTSGASIYSDRAGVQRSLYTAGVRTSIGGFATQFDLAADNIGGSAAAIGVAGRVLGANAVLRHSEYSGGLLDETNPESDPARPIVRRSEINIDDGLRLGRRIIPVNLRLFRDDFVDGGATTSAAARASASLGPILYSTSLAYDRIILPGVPGADRIRGTFEASSFRNYRWQVRSAINYDIAPDFRANQFTVTVDHAISRSWSLRFAANQNLQSPSGTNLQVSSITQTQFGDLALTGQYDTVSSSWSVGAQINFGLGYNPQSRRYELTRQGPGSGGSVLLHAFVDDNGDGRYEPGERPVENVIIEGGVRPARTGKDGLAYATGFGAAPTARAQVSVQDLENQSVKPPPSVLEFTPRAGGVLEIPYPLVPTGDVMVNISLRRPDGQLVGLSATHLRLVNEKGQIIESTTEYDGSATFLDVPVGTYQLELDPEQAQRLRMRLVAPQTVTIKPEGAVNRDVRAEVVFAPRQELSLPPPD